MALPNRIPSDRRWTPKPGRGGFSISRTPLSRTQERGARQDSDSMEHTLRLARAKLESMASLLGMTGDELCAALTAHHGTDAAQAAYIRLQGGDR